MELSQDTLTLWFLNAVKIALILIVGLLLARNVRGWVLRLGMGRRVPINLAVLLGNLAQVIIALIALVLILPTFGVDWSALLTLLGAVGLAASLAFQDLLKNIIAGVYILVERPFQIGEVIAIGKDGTVVGTVQSIELRITTLRTDEGLQVIVPNGTIFTEIITNRSAFNLQRDVIEVTTPLGDLSLPALTTRITEAIGTVSDVCSTPTPTVRVEALSDKAVRLHIECWTPPPVEVRAGAAVVQALRAALPAAEVTILS